VVWGAAVGRKLSAKLICKIHLRDAAAIEPVRFSRYVGADAFRSDASAEQDVTGSAFERNARSISSQVSVSDMLFRFPAGSLLAIKNIRENILDN
jgi:hypothetical protein